MRLTNVAHLRGRRALGGLSGSTPTPTFANLAEALSDFLASDATLSAAFPSQWWNSAASRDVDTASAFGVFQINESSVQNVIKPGYSLETVPVHFWILSPLAESAEALAKSVRQRLLGTSIYTPTTFSFADGLEVNRYWATGGHLSIDEERAPYNADCFRRLVPIVFVIARGE